MAEERKNELWWEEEKKESSPPKTGSGGLTTTASDKASAGLPIEIINKKYASERELRIDLEKVGVDDLQIILNKEGFPIWREMPGEAHRAVVDEIGFIFGEWKNGQLITGGREANVFVNDSFSCPKNEKRCPDFAIFGPDRMERGRVQKRSGKYMNPHVIIQFSWTNNIREEALAVNDMMHFAGVGEYIDLERPVVAYLIKATRRGKASDSPVYGFDVFQVNQDECTPIFEPTMKYRCGHESQEDTVITIAPEVMGLAGDASEPFKIEMRDIRKALESLEIVFVPVDESEM